MFRFIFIAIAFMMFASLSIEAKEYVHKFQEKEYGSLRDFIKKSLKEDFPDQSENDKELAEKLLLETIDLFYHRHDHALVTDRNKVIDSFKRYFQIGAKNHFPTGRFVLWTSQLCDLLSYYCSTENQDAQETVKKSLSKLGQNILFEEKARHNISLSEDEYKDILSELDTKLVEVLSDPLMPYGKQPLTEENILTIRSNILTTLPNLQERFAYSCSILPEDNQSSFKKAYLKNLILDRLVRSYSHLAIDFSTSPRTIELREALTAKLRAKQPSLPALDLSKIKYKDNHLESRERTDFFWVCSMFPRDIIKLSECNLNEKWRETLSKYKQIKTIAYNVKWEFGFKEYDYSDIICYGRVIFDREKALITVIYQQSPSDSLWYFIRGRELPFTIQKQSDDSFAILDKLGFVSEQYKLKEHPLHFNEKYLNYDITNAFHMLANTDKSIAIAPLTGNSLVEKNYQWWYPVGSYQESFRPIPDCDGQEFIRCFYSSPENKKVSIKENIIAENGQISNVKMSFSPLSIQRKFNTISHVDSTHSYEFAVSDTLLPGGRQIVCDMNSIQGYALPSTIRLLAENREIGRLTITKYEINNSKDSELLAGDYSKKPVVIDHPMWHAQNALEKYKAYLRTDVSLEKWLSLSKDLADIVSNENIDFELSMFLREAFIGCAFRLGKEKFAVSGILKQIKSFQDIESLDPLRDYLWFHLVRLVSLENDKAYNDIIQSLKLFSLAREVDVEQGKLLLRCPSRILEMSPTKNIEHVFNDIANLPFINGLNIPDKDLEKLAYFSKTNKPENTFNKYFAFIDYTELPSDAVDIEDNHQGATITDGNHSIMSEGKKAPEVLALNNACAMVLNAKSLELSEGEKEYAMACFSDAIGNSPEFVPDLSDLTTWLENNLAQRLNTSHSNFDFLKTMLTAQWYLYFTLYPSHYEYLDSDNEGKQIRWIVDQINGAKDVFTAGESDPVLKNIINQGFILGLSDMEKMRQGVFSQILFKGVNETIFNHYREKVDKRMKKLMDRLNKQFKSIDNAWIEDTYFKLLNGNIQQIDYMRAGILSQKKSIYELYVEKICRLVLVNYVSLSMPNLRKYPFMEVATQTVRYKPGCGVFVTVDPLLE